MAEGSCDYLKYPPVVMNNFSQWKTEKRELKEKIKINQIQFNKKSLSKKCKLFDIYGSY